MIIPKPVLYETRPGRFVLGRRTALVADPALSEVAAWLRGELGAVTGGELLPGGQGQGAITLGLGDLAPEAYRLTVGAEGVRIVAGGPAGAFYGAQTLRQLLPSEAFRKAGIGGTLALPAVHVEDEPRFGYRGCLLDVARHFMTKADVLRFIDLMAMHKLNVLHLHRQTTRDGGWRSGAIQAHRGGRVAQGEPDRLNGAMDGARTAATTRRTTSARSSPTRRAVTSWSCPRSTCRATPRPRSPPTPSSATSTSRSRCAPPGASASTC
ncbi:glycoside hydrolase family 20 zincin-like fold domain-containing protein [Nonomuraea dietziae]|uniref:glycoside hydrolase family 20 zincin-like fold domain-containing protein n=1 Tax=Nonomuraea dietziae TaxID=65515 RepID=UPI0031E276CA